MRLTAKTRTRLPFFLPVVLKPLHVGGGQSTAFRKLFDVVSFPCHHIIGIQVQRHQDRPTDRLIDVS